MIDDLYGEGAWERMQREFVLPPWFQGVEASFEQAEMPDGGVRVIVTWTVDGDQIGQVKVDHYPDHAYVSTVSLVPAAQVQGVSATIATRWGDYWESVGLPYVEAYPTRSPLDRMFQLIGAERAENGNMRWATSGRDQRRKQYDAWKQGRAPEPDWHRSL